MGFSGLKIKVTSHLKILYIITSANLFLLPCVVMFLGSWAQDLDVFRGHYSFCHSRERRLQMATHTWHVSKGSRERTGQGWESLCCYEDLSFSQPNRRLQVKGRCQQDHTFGRKQMLVLTAKLSHWLEAAQKDHAFAQQLRGILKDQHLQVVHHHYSQQLNGSFQKGDLCRILSWPYLSLMTVQDEGQRGI